MQTIEEYKEYTKQLEGEVKQWHDAFDASQAQVKELVKENLRLERERVEQNSIIETCANELEELRLHEVYSKSEAYAVIAEKDKEIAELKEKHKTEVKELLCLIRDKDNNFNRAFDSEEKELRHHKYKLCLAMAQVLEHVCPITNRKAKWRDKWHKRWLELSEKFKEEK